MLYYPRVRQKAEEKRDVLAPGLKHKFFQARGALGKDLMPLYFIQGKGKLRRPVRPASPIHALILPGPSGDSATRRLGAAIGPSRRRAGHSGSGFSHGGERNAGHRE